MVNHKCKAVSLSHSISHPVVIRPFCALLAQGMSDFMAIEQHREIEGTESKYGDIQCVDIQGTS